MSVQVGYPSRESRRHLARQKMALRKRRGIAQNVQQNGLYVHSSPPRVVQMNPSVIRQWLRNGEIDKLETVVLEGQGHKLVGEYSPDAKTRAFLKTVPQYMAKIELLHDAVSRGQIQDTQKLLKEDSRKKLCLCKGQQGVGLLHKAVYFDHQDLAKWMLESYPLCVNVKDREGRTALHYCAATQDPTALWELLVLAGVEENAEDSKGHLANYYLDHPKELSLPTLKKPSGTMKRYTDGKDGLVPSRANIRIWIHDRDLGRLQQLLWEGHGGKLRVETSNNPRVKRFLDAVPYIMGLIKDTHTAAINDDLDIFRKRTAEPVPSQIMLSKDENGLNPLHKAAGLGHEDVVNTILERCPKALNSSDLEGRTPLHYAAVLKDNGSMYDHLLHQGADEAVEDQKGKTPLFYRNKPTDLETKNLNVVPDAPRTAASFPPAWDWRILNNAAYDFGHINGFIAPVSTDSYTHSEPDIISEKTSAAEVVYLDVPAPNLEEKRPTDPQEEEDEGVGEEPFPEEDSEPLRESDLIEAEAFDNPVVTNLGEEMTDHIEETDKDHGPGDEEFAVENHKEDPDEHWSIDKREDGEIMQHDDNEVVHNEREEDFEDEGLEKERDLTPEEEGGNPENGVDGEEETKVHAEEEEDTREFVDRVVEEREEELQLENGPLDPEVTELVRQGNMEELATMVLNGEGRKLVGHSSDDPELQSFLSNVPSYMSKIRAVHIAAREGQLRDLQGALDRRKFAVARDSVSPMGATPLHVATLFGNTTIVRYLGARFPETLNAKDLDNRTPLHYAATIRDNGHYYNMLLNLGANPTVKDNRGRTAEYYLRNPDRLTHKMLLAEFGAPEQLADDSLADKVPNDVYSARRNVDDMEMIETIERCYELIRGESPDGSAKTSNPYLRKHLKPVTFHRLKAFLTRMDHNLLDVIWPGAKKLPVDPQQAEEDDALEITDIVFENGGVIVPDYESYKVFGEFLVPLVKDLNGLNSKVNLIEQPPVQFENIVEDDSDDDEEQKRQKEKERNSKVELDSSTYVSSYRIECTRNLEEEGLPSGLTLSQLESVERIVSSALKSLPVDGDETKEEDGTRNRGIYHNLTEVFAENSAVLEQLQSAGLMIKLSDENANFDTLLHGPHWPHGRGVYVFENGTTAVWVNVQEHIRFIAHNSEGMKRSFDDVGRIVTELEKVLDFKRDETLGVLAARPSFTGNGLRLSADINLPLLGKEEENLRSLCNVRGLKVRPDLTAEHRFHVWNRQNLSINEYHTFRDFCSGVNNIIELERSFMNSGATPTFTGYLGNAFKKMDIKI